MLEQRRRAERLSDLYLGAMLSLFLLFPGFEGYGNITFWKTGLLGLLTLRYALRAAICPGRRGFFALFRRKDAAGRLILGYWGFTALSAVLSAAPMTAIFGSGRREGLLTISLYCLSFFLLSAPGRAKAWHLGLFGASVCLNDLVALWQLAGGNPLGLYPAGMNYYDAYVRYPGEYLGTVGNADLLSALLCAAIPVFWVGLLRLPGRRRFWLLLPLGLSLAVLLLSGVSGGVVGVLGSVLIGLPVVLPEKKQRKKAAITALFALIAGIFVIFCFGDRMGGTLYELHALLHAQVSETFGSGRVYIWREVLALVPERLWLGGGADTLGLRTTAAFERFDPTRGAVLRTAVDAAHCEYLHILVNQGMLALLCWAGALLALGRRWTQTAPRSPVAAMAGCGALGYCLQAFFGLSSPITTPFLWLALGLLAGDNEEFR